MYLRLGDAELATALCAHDRVADLTFAFRDAGEHRLRGWLGVTLIPHGDVPTMRCTAGRRLSASRPLASGSRARWPSAPARARRRFVARPV